MTYSVSLIVSVRWMPLGSLRRGRVRRASRASVIASGVFGGTPNARSPRCASSAPARVSAARSSTETIVVVAAIRHDVFAVLPPSSGAAVMSSKDARHRSAANVTAAVLRLVDRQTHCG